MSTKLAKAVARLEACDSGEWIYRFEALRRNDTRLVLDALKEAQGQGLTRAERAVVRAAMAARNVQWTQRASDDFDRACDRLEVERAKAKKASKR